MQTDCNTRHLTTTAQKERHGAVLLSFIAYLTRLTSWLLVAVVLAVYAIFRVKTGHAAFFTVLLFLSGVFHLLREASDVWNSYPYWVDAQRRANSSREVSTPFRVAGAILALSLCVYNMAWTGFFAFLILILCDELVAFSVSREGEEKFRNLREALANRTIASKDSGNDNDCSAIYTPTVESSPESLESSTSDSGETVLCLKRRRLEGCETISGEATIEFEPDSKTAFLNIAFCPPFAGTPGFDFDQVSGEDTSIRTALLQPFGVRLEAYKTSKEHLDVDTDDPVTIEFFASYPGTEGN
jgi:hypothetical protein